MSGVTVVREPFTPRDLEVGRLSGLVRACIVLDSYVHVSSGRERIEFVTRIVDVRALVKSVGDALLRGDYSRIEGLSQSLRMGYVDNVSYGDRVCVPGSTVKGLLRARLELCPSREGSSIACMQTQLPPITTPPPVGQHGWRHARIWSRAVAEDRGFPCNPIQTGDYSLCKVCDLFGAPGVVGRVMPSNFCTDRNSCEWKDLPHGERVVALKPGTKLEGYVAFNALTLDELGILFLAMGLTKNSTKGVRILIGKHKYAYRDMGVAHFEVMQIEFPRRFVDTLRHEGLEFEVEDHTIVCRGSNLEKLVSIAIDRALERYPQLRELHGFSEADVRSKVIA